MAYTQAQRDALANAIATGALETDADGIRIRYRSLAEMRSLLAEMDRQLTPATARPSVTYAAFNRGW